MTVGQLVPFLFIGAVFTIWFVRQLDELAREQENNVTELRPLPGDIVQITDERPGLIGALLMVEEVKAWGIQGFIHHVNSFEEASRIYLRLETGRFERIGRAVMMPTELVVPDEPA